jgi:hypothetical protein
MGLSSCSDIYSVVFSALKGTLCMSETVLNTSSLCGPLQSNCHLTEVFVLKIHLLYILWKFLLKNICIIHFIGRKDV